MIDGPPPVEAPNKGGCIFMSTNAFLTSPPHPAVPDQLIVVRDHAGWVQALRETAEGHFTVLVDRRHGERRQRLQRVLEERRGGERRTPLAVAATCCFWHLCWSALATARRATDRRAEHPGQTDTSFGRP